MSDPSGKVVSMTASPLAPTNLLTVDEYAALGEDEHGRTELMEGNLVMSPSPTPDHNVAIARLLMQLEPQLPAEFELIPDIDVDLQLALPGAPGTVRRPDLVVVGRDARQRVRSEGGPLRASDLLVVVEIVSPGSRRIDRIVKRAEYADAGIGHYWIVDLDPPVSLTAGSLLGAEYDSGGPVTGVFLADDPFPVRVDLANLG